MVVILFMWGGEGLKSQHHEIIKLFISDSKL